MMVDNFIDYEIDGLLSRLEITSAVLSDDEGTEDDEDGLTSPQAQRILYLIRKS